MANQITGKIEVIGSMKSILSKDKTKTYYSREIVLDATRRDPYTGERMFESFPSFEFSGEKCDELDNYQPGQIVTISFDVSGVKYNDKQTGEIKYFNRVRGFKIELRQSVQQGNVLHSDVNVAAQEAPANNLPF